MRLARDRIMEDDMIYFRNSPGGMEEMLRKEKRKKRWKTEELHSILKYF